MYISTPIQELIRAAMEEERAKEIPRNEPLISVPTRTSRASFIYERMRNVVDYKEEHLIRRNAIERILRRLVTAHGRKNLAENLLRELIHARYVPNDAIPQRKLGELERIFQKYFSVLGQAHIKEMADKNTLAGWTLGLMATEVDEFLVPPYVMHASINAMYDFIAGQLHTEQDIAPTELNRQIYLSVSRMLYKNDDDTLAYHLLLTYYPNWANSDEAMVAELSDDLPDMRAAIGRELNHPSKERINALARKYVAYFIILREVIVKNPREAWQAMQPEQEFTRLVKRTCTAHYAQARAKLKRSIARSVVYLVLTKFLLAIILEIPIEYWLLGRFDSLPLLINLVFPPVLLIVIARSTKLPDEENTQKIADGITSIVSKQSELVQLAKTKSRGFFMQLMFVLLYAALFLISFDLFVTILETLHFSAIGMLVFLFFLSLVSLFAYRIRRMVQELLVIAPKRGIVKSGFSFLSIPVLHAGKWMSTKFAKINIFIFILDFVIEAPFKSFMKITEEWMDYVHEKKEEI